MKTIYLFFLIFFNYLSSQTYQVVNVNDFKVNGCLPLFTNPNILIKCLNKIDKIEPDEPGCSNYDEEVQKGTKFYRYTKNGIKYYVYNKTAEFEEIDLKNHQLNYVLYKSEKLSNKTTLKRLKVLFPDSYKAYAEDMKKYKEAIFRLKFNKDWDDELQIAIVNNKICSIFYWTPC